MKECIKKNVILAAECFILGFAVAAGMAVCSLLFEMIFG